MEVQAQPFDTILVPLDGSSLAEQALPVAERLAQATGSSVLLVRVMTLTSPALTYPGSVTAPEVYQAIFDAEMHDIEEYLARQAEALRAHRITVQTQVNRGAPELALLDVASRPDVDLIVITTHGRTGLARFALGSVADRLVRGGHKPVLLLRAFDHACPVEPFDRALIALDGSARAEQALPLVVWLAGRILTKVRLVRVIPAEAATSAEKEARQYLDGVGSQLAHQLADCPCEVATAVLRGPAAEQLLRAAEMDCELVIMTTHGRTGPTRWVLGSVADRIVYGAHVPVLLIRSSEGRGRPEPTREAIASTPD